MGALSLGLEFNSLARMTGVDPVELVRWLLKCGPHDGLQ